MLQSGPFPLSVFPARLVLLLLLLIWGTTAWSQPAAWRKATHPRLAADRLASTKLSAADKGGAEGDAAAASDRYDMLRYHLNLRVDPEINQLEGHVKMVFSSLAGGLDVMVFDLGGDLELLGVEHLSGPLTFTSIPGKVFPMERTVCSKSLSQGLITTPPETSLNPYRFITVAFGKTSLSCLKRGGNEFDPPDTTIRTRVRSSARNSSFMNKRV